MRTVLVLAVFLVPLPASADTSCWTIKDPDQRADWRARATQSQGQCVGIADYSLRQECRARLGAGENVCNAITSAWERQKCREPAEKRN